MKVISFVFTYKVLRVLVRQIRVVYVTRTAVSAHNHAKVTFFIRKVFVYLVRFKDVRTLDQFRAMSFFAVFVLLILSSYRFSLGFSLPLLLFLKHLLLMQVV